MLSCAATPESEAAVKHGGMAAPFRKTAIRNGRSATVLLGTLSEATPESGVTRHSPASGAGRSKGT